VNGAIALSLEHIDKRFGSVAALSDASLTLRARTVHALLGENGAGKSTLMRIAFGLERADAGAIRVHGERVSLTSPADAITLGIGMVHQHFTLVPTMTVAENVALGGHGRFDPARARARVRAVGSATGLALDPDARVSTLAVGGQQRLEIVKALASGARILILDEPTAVLAPDEVTELLEVLRRFAADGGSVIIITHKLREARAAADDVTVLRRGRTVLCAPSRAVTEQSLAEAMLGGAPEAIIVPRRGSPGEIVLEARGISIADARGTPRVSDVTVQVRGGEILGVAGVEGAGQHELLRALAGRLRPTSGTIVAPDDVGFVPEDRQRDALVLEFTLDENVALRGAGRARGRMRWSDIANRTTELVRRFDVRAPGVKALARTLSGGNQQKLVLGRELDGAPRALVVESPTRGLDVAAGAAVHRRLLAARDAGTAVVVYSSDLDEVLSLADRVLVMFAGRARELPPDRDAVGHAMLGLAVP
jgi:simple sugar transport system ATP-binding protein